MCVITITTLRPIELTCPSRLPQRGVSLESQAMRVRWLSWFGRACGCGIALVCLACSGSGGESSASSGGSALGEDGGRGGAAHGGSAATGGSLIQPSGGAGAGASGGSTSSAGACACPSGGDPYSVLVQGDGDDSVLIRNVETPATAALACGGWLTGSLRGALVSTCGGTRNVTFAACVGADASPPCLLVDHNAVTYVDRDGQRWTGAASDLMPSTALAIRDLDRQEGTFWVEVTREGVTRRLSVAYILCGPGKPAALLPC
jgi:hypothetical protein